jgi:hypothetical protein
LVGETRPGFAGLVGLAGRNGKNFDTFGVKLGGKIFGVKRPDVGVGDDRVAMGRNELANLGSNLG